jgi:hypothetical protein
MKLLAGLIAALVLLPAAAAAADPVPVLVTFQGTGSWTIDNAYQFSGEDDDCTTAVQHGVAHLDFKAVYHTWIDDAGHLQGATGALDGPQGDYRYTVTFNGTCGPIEKTCADFPIPPDAPAPKLDVADVGGAQRLSATAITRAGFDLRSLPDCFLGYSYRDASIIDTALPGALTGFGDYTGQLPATISVGSADATQPVADCAGIGEPADPVNYTTADCDQSESWTGTIKIQAEPCHGSGSQIASVTDNFSGDPVDSAGRTALGLGGTSVTEGQGFGAGQSPDGVTIHFGDGSSMSVPPGGQGKVESCDPTTIHATSGDGWHAITSTSTGVDEPVIDTPNAGAAPRGTNYFVSYFPATRMSIYKLVAGLIDVWPHAHPDQKATLTPGQTALIAGDSAPALVIVDSPQPPPPPPITGGPDPITPPAFKAAPKLLSLRVLAHGRRVRLKLSAPGRVTLTLQRRKGKHYVKTAATRVNAQAGTHTIKLPQALAKRLKPGRWRLVATLGATRRVSFKR